MTRAHAGPSPRATLHGRKFGAMAGCHVDHTQPDFHRQHRCRRHCGGAFWMSAHASPGVRVALLVIAALGCQARLICNLLDGLVAIESGKRAADGAFWNEFPDRISDILIIVGLGLGAGAPTLAWAAASLAVLTAYTRELGQNCGAPADFSGPMAKPHRMALVTIASLSAIAEQMMGGGVMILTAALWILAVGAAITTARRAMRIVNVLRGDGQR